MKYLKSYSLFESIDSRVEGEIQDYFYDLTDEGVEYKYHTIKENNFYITISDCQEDQLSVIVDRINKSGDFAIRYTKVKDIYYIFELKFINKFKYLIEDLKMSKLESGNIIFKRGGDILMRQDLKNGYLYVLYSKIWSVFESYFPSEYESHQGFMSSLVEETFKFRPLTPIDQVRLLLP